VWHLYVALTADGGATWTTADATPDAPVQKGCIWLQGGQHVCRNLADFMDATVDAEGRVLVGYDTGCTGACVTSTDDTLASGSTDTLASIVREDGGMRLFVSSEPSVAAGGLAGRRERLRAAVASAAV
jgi:hypothetical protein